MVLGLVWVIFLARNLSVELFGTYNLVNAFISVFSFLPDLGVGIIVTREIAKNKKKADIFLGSSFFLNVSLAVITFLVILITSHILKYEILTQNLILIASFTLFFSTVRSVGIFYFDGMEKMNFSAVLNSLNTVFLIVFAAILYLKGFGLYGIFFGMLCGTIISLIITWSMTLKYITPKFVLHFQDIKQLLYEGFPLGLAAFSALIYTKIDSVMLAQYLGAKSVGIYSSATPFVQGLIGLLNVPFIVAVFPALSRLSVLDKDRLIAGIKKSLLIIALWSIPASILVSLSAFYIIPLIFGSKYNQAIPILQVLIFFVPFASLSALLYKVLIIFNKQYIYLLISIIGALVNIILNLYLIPKYAIYGAVYASLFTQVILFILYTLLVIKYCRDFTIQKS